MAEFKPSYLVEGLPGHPLHPPLTDATIGIYTFATLASVLSKVGVAEHAFAQAWWLALVVGLVTTVFTALTGLLDWLKIKRGTELWKTATLHLSAMVTATVVFLIAALAGHGGYVDHEVTTGAVRADAARVRLPLGRRLARRCRDVRARDARAQPP